MFIDDVLVCDPALIIACARIHRIAMGHAGDAEGLNDCITTRVFEDLVGKSLDGVLHSRHGLYPVHVGPLLHFLSGVNRAYRRVVAPVPDRNLWERPRVA